MRVMKAGAVLLALGVVVGWSGFALAQMANVKAGEFLTPEEYMKLKQEEAMAYCSDLEAELNSQTARANNIKQEIDRQRAEADRLQSQVNNLDERIGTMETVVAQMESDYGAYRTKAFSHTVVKGEYLSLISSYDQIYGDAMKWPRLYRANRDQIEDPNLIYPDQVLKVPHGYPAWHVVIGGEFLSKIANYWEIYNDGRQWPRIYEANKDQIRDPDMVYPDQVLTIPR